MIDAAEAAFTTDFAFLVACQEEAEADDLTDFAYSGPGYVRMACGHKNARVHIRVERWDGVPPEDHGWQDTLEVSFEEVPGGGELNIRGFDPSEVGLDITGFGRGRVQVFARGRQRYEYGDASFDLSTLEPEEWLLRFYPGP